MWGAQAGEGRVESGELGTVGRGLLILGNAHCERDTPDGFIASVRDLLLLLPSSACDMVYHIDMSAPDAFVCSHVCMAIQAPA